MSDERIILYRYNFSERYYYKKNRMMQLSNRKILIIYGSPYENIS